MWVLWRWRRQLSRWMVWQEEAITTQPRTAPPPPPPSQTHQSDSTTGPRWTVTHPTHHGRRSPRYVRRVRDEVISYDAKFNRCFQIFNSFKMHIFIRTLMTDVIWSHVMYVNYLHFCSPPFFSWFLIVYCCIWRRRRGQYLSEISKDSWKRKYDKHFLDWEIMFLVCISYQ